MDLQRVVQQRLHRLVLMVFKTWLNDIEVNFADLGRWEVLL